MSTASRTAVIARLNDERRRTFTTGDVMLTAGIRALPPAQLRAVLARVRHHDDFTQDNDPHGERDFGALDLEGLGRVFWKIDYHDPTRTFGSEDPADPPAPAASSPSCAPRSIEGARGGRSTR